MGKRSFYPLLTLLCVLLFAGTAWGADFTADIIMEGPMGQMQSKLYSRDGVLRQENAGPMGRTATISWSDEDRTVLLLIDQGTYMEIGDTEDALGFDFSDMGSDLSGFEDEAGVTKLGTEKIQGFVCEKISIVDPEMPGARSTIWFSEKFGFPLRTLYESPEGSMSMECQNIVVGTPDASLFEIPQGFQRLDIPMGMPSEM